MDLATFKTSFPCQKNPPHPLYYLLDPEKKVSAAPSHLNLKKKAEMLLEKQQINFMQPKEFIYKPQNMIHP